MAGCQEAIEKCSQSVDVGLKYCFYKIELYQVHHGVIFGYTDNLGSGKDSEEYKKDMVRFDASRILCLDR